MRFHEFLILNCKLLISSAADRFSLPLHRGAFVEELLDELMQPGGDFRRLQLAEDAKRALGNESGITLMEMLPPVGWADVATKDDLARLEDRFAASLHQELSAWMWRSVGVTTALLAAFAALIKL